VWREEKKHASFCPSLLNLFVEFLVSGIEFGFFFLSLGDEIFLLFSLFFGVCSGSVLFGLRSLFSFRNSVCLCVSSGAFMRACACRRIRL
jgi:hypothetical protein